MPEDSRGFIVTGRVGLLGLLIEWLRKRTSKPLEVVAVAEKEITPRLSRLAVLVCNIVGLRVRSDAIAVMKFSGAAIMQVA